MPPLITLIAALILWTLPWSIEALPHVAELDVALGCDQRPGFEGVCGAYYDDFTAHERTIRLCEHDCLRAELRHLVIHESQHHMQLRYRIHQHAGGYAAFRAAVIVEMARGDYDERVRSIVADYLALDETSIVYSELHAELPCLLGMNVPTSLQQWYPWFVFD